MLIAHGPAGYLLTRVLARTVFKRIVLPVRSNRMYQAMIAAGMFGGILPDFDFIYHIFIDSDRTPHHSYFTHFPLFWMALLGIALLAGRWQRFRKAMPVMVILCLSALLHLICDTLTGTVYWLAPLNSAGFNVFKVADVNIWWVNNYMYHWTFLIEIGIVITAGVIFLRVQETTLYIIDHFRQHEKLRQTAIRLGVCTFGLLVIVLVGSLQFNIDNKIVRKVKELKHRVVRMAISS
ncbi:MAG: metal-dependent hydrolase [Chitinispirillaceae bacterium]|nr:metal-dependent hydrolase [Chitinispirillaceae bacterium]